MLALALLFAFAAPLPLGAAAPAFAAPSDASATVAERLREVAGSTESVTFWSGGTAERPAYTWTFEGRELSREQLGSLDALDLGITSTTEDADGSGTADTLVLGFSHEGALPAPARISLAVPEGLEGLGGRGDLEGRGDTGGGSGLGLFAYDGQRGSFTGIESDLPVEDGYVSFTLTHCSVWALSTIDLSASGAASAAGGASGAASAVGEAAGAADVAAGAASGADAGADGTSSTSSSAAAALATVSAEGTTVGLPAFLSAAPVLLLSVLVIGAGGLVAALVRGRMRRRELAAMQQGWGVSSVVFEDIPSIDELSEIEEPRC
jgi:hypothetical protein